MLFTFYFSTSSMSGVGCRIWVACASCHACSCALICLFPFQYLRPATGKHLGQTNFNMHGTELSIDRADKSTDSNDKQTRP